MTWLNYGLRNVRIVSTSKAGVPGDHQSEHPVLSPDGACSGAIGCRP